MRPALDLLFAETDHRRCGSALLANRLFEVVLIQLLRWIIDNPQAIGVTSGLLMGLNNPRLAKALVALHQAPGETWSLERMASVAGMSRSAFAQVFKTATGTTPSAYLTDWRLMVAATLLRTGQRQNLSPPIWAFQQPLHLIVRLSSATDALPSAGFRKRTTARIKTKNSKHRCCRDQAKHCQLWTCLA